MLMTPRNPGEGIYPTTGDYVHAMEVTGAQRFLFVSGTMGLEEDGSAADSLDEQLRLLWKNIRRILQEADMTTENIARVTSYLRDPDFAEANQEMRLLQLGERLVPTTVIVVETLKRDWLAEIEIIAVA